MALTSWEEVTPTVEEQATERLNSILARADMTPVSRQVVRWRMLLAFRYLRRDMRRGGEDVTSLNVCALN